MKPQDNTITELENMAREAFREEAKRVFLVFFSQYAAVNWQNGGEKAVKAALDRMKAGTRLNVGAYVLVKQHIAELNKNVEGGQNAKG